MSFWGALWGDFRRDLALWLYQKVGGASAATGPDPNPQALSSASEIYRVLCDVLRDQVVEQAASASSNDLEAVGLIAANLALAVALLLLKATRLHLFHGLGFVPWWVPLPVTALSVVLLVQPVRPASRSSQFKGGPNVPSLIHSLAENPQSVESALVRVIRDLQESWEINDRLLEKERRYITLGGVALGVASLLTVGFYTYALV